MPAAVTGVAPLIDQDTARWRCGRADAVADYLRWWQPDGDAGRPR